MIRLLREVRFFATAGPGDHRGTDANHWAGTAPSAALPFWVIRVIVEGWPDRHTGYVCDIKWLDNLVREIFPPALQNVHSFSEAATVGAKCTDLLKRRIGPLRLFSVQIKFSPHTFLTFVYGIQAMTTLTQSFEFSASHRLYCPERSEEDNRRLFGKCSNPHGHGHNYVLEVTIDAAPGEAGSKLNELDRVVQKQVIERFDHKNLNVECAEFADLNPTVENIARVIFDRLAEAPDAIRPTSVRVWETAKTYAECFGASESSRIPPSR